MKNSPRSSSWPTSSRKPIPTRPSGSEAGTKMASTAEPGMTVPLPTSLPWPVPVLPSQWSLADLHRHLGGVPLERFRLYPPPGMATEQDVLRLQEKGDLPCELIDGIL